ncbi:MAG: hypothetical protein R3C44_02880 [Chloroflexota bacterium]
MSSIAAFERLAYYDENPDLVQTVEIKRLPEDEPLIQMETSTGDMRYYRRWGTLTLLLTARPAR